MDLCTEAQKLAMKEAAEEEKVLDIIELEKPVGVIIQLYLKLFLRLLVQNKVCSKCRSQSIQSQDCN